jgi:hypothetical protein
VATIVALITASIAALTSPPPKAPPPPPERKSVVSTSYCETGQMANGERTYFGAVAMAERIGSRWRALTGPFAGVVFTVADRYRVNAKGVGSTQFDVALPGQCARARIYGLRRIVIERA